MTVQAEFDEGTATAQVVIEGRELFVEFSDEEEIGYHANLKDGEQECWYYFPSSMSKEVAAIFAAISYLIDEADQDQ